MLLPPSHWMVVSGTTTLYPTNGVGGTSTTAGNSHLLVPGTASSTFIQPLSQRRPSIRVWGYLIVTGPAANTTLTLESHDGSISHVSTIVINTAAISVTTYTPLGSGILIVGGLRATLAAAATVNVYYSLES